VLAGAQLVQRYELGCATLPVQILVVFCVLPVAALFLPRLLAGVAALLLARSGLPSLILLSGLALLTGTLLALLGIPFPIVCHEMSPSFAVRISAHAVILRDCLLLVAVASFAGWNE